MNYRATAIILLQLGIAGQAWGDCSDASRNGFDCTRNARQALRATNDQVVRQFTEQAKATAEKALTEAQQCGCYDAEAPFYRAFRTARKALKAVTAEERTTLLQQVEQAAAAGTEAAERCGN
jgi:hypothetical protein